MIKETFNKIMNLDISRKKFLVLLGGSVLSLTFLSRGALADVWLRNDDSVITNSNEIRGITNGTINRTAGLVTSIVIDGRTITINRDVNDIITGYEDSDYEWTLTRDGDNIITDWGVAKI
jgi:hypothetical protein